MTTVTLPYDINTFVRIPPNNHGVHTTLFGQIVGFYVFSPTDMTVCVSGYKAAWSGEFLLREIEVMTDEEIEELVAPYEQ